MKKINILLLLGMVSLSVSCYANVTDKKNQREHVHGLLERFYNNIEI